MFIFSVKVREYVDKKGGLICKKIEDIIIIESENVSLEDEEEKRKNNEYNVQQVKKENNMMRHGKESSWKENLREKGEKS